MKKKRFMKLLALASCVTLLTGCESEAFFGLGKYWNQFADWGSGLLEKLGLKKEEKKDEKESEDKPSGEGEQGGEGEGGGVTPEPTKSLTVEGLPESLEVLESLNLDDFVRLENLESYEVALDEGSEEIAELEGHVLKAKNEGTINFTVSSGELSKKCSVESVFATRQFLYDAFSEAGNRYTMLSYDFDDNDQLFIDDYFVHSEKYIMTKNFDKDTDGNIVPGGWLSFDGEDLFEFTIKEGEQEDEVIVGARASSIYFSVYNPVIEADYYFGANAQFVYDEENNEKLLVITGDACKYFAQEALMCYQGQINASSGTYVFSQVQFVLGEYEDDTTGETEQFVEWYAYVTLADKEYLYGFGEVLFGDEAGDELLDEYCVPENKPAGVDYWNFMDSLYGGTGAVGLGDFFLSEDSLLYYPRGIYSLSYGWCDDNGDPIEIPADAVGGNFEYMPVGSKLMFLSDNSAWDVSEVKDETTGEVTGYKPNSGKMYVAGEGENPGVVYDIFSSASGYTAEVADEASVWEADKMLFAGLRDRANYAPGMIASAEHVTVEVPAQNEGEEPTQQYSHSVITFESGKVGGLIDALVDGDNGLYFLGALIDAYAQAGRNIVDYFDGVLTLVPGSGIAQLRLSFSWDDNQNWAVTFTSRSASSAATQAQGWEADMLANVINAA